MPQRCGLGDVLIGGEGLAHEIADAFIPRQTIIEALEEGSR